MNITTILMSNLNLAIQTIVASLAISLAASLFKWLNERLPSNVRKALWDHAQTAVKAVEQHHAAHGWTSEEKRDYAKGLIIASLKKFKLPVPVEEFIEDVIEQIVYDLNRTKRDTLDLEKIKHTGPVRAVDKEF